MAKAKHGIFMAVGVGGAAAAAAAIEAGGVPAAVTATVAAVGAPAILVGIGVAAGVGVISFGVYKLLEARRPAAASADTRIEVPSPPADGA